MVILIDWVLKFMCRSIQQHQKHKLQTDYAFLNNISARNSTVYYIVVRPSLFMKYLTHFYY